MNFIFIKIDLQQGKSNGYVSSGAYYSVSGKMEGSRAKVMVLMMFRGRELSTNRTLGQQAIHNML